ncbi:MAG: 3-isopropylmalate dehydratase large subunit, partial [Actinomycetota bacterium]
MGMTITEKILASHAGLDRVVPGQLVNCRVDLAMGNDVTAPVAIERFRDIGAASVWDPGRIALVCSHFVPAKDIAAAKLCQVMRNFAREQGIEGFYEVGRGGVEHVLLPQEALVAPGDLVVGADSHTCTYGAVGAFSTGIGSTDLAAVWATGEIWLKVPASIRIVYSGTRQPWVVGKDWILHVIGRLGDDGALYQAMEHTGPALAELSQDSRFTMTNMAIEAGAKSGIMEPDQTTIAYVRARQEATGRTREFPVYSSDPDADYAQVMEVDVSAVEPQVAFPHLPSRAVGLSQVGDVQLDQVFIGSCTNGRMEDLRLAAHVLRGRKVNPRLRLVVIPATQEIWRQALKEGLLD